MLRTGRTRGFYFFTIDFLGDAKKRKKQTFLRRRVRKGEARACFIVSSLQKCSFSTLALSLVSFFVNLLRNDHLTNNVDDHFLCKNGLTRSFL